MTPGVQVPREVLEQMHRAALTRLFAETEELLEDYRAVADEVSSSYAEGEFARLRCEAQNHPDAVQLAALRGRVERQKLALARAVEEWREGFPYG